MSTQKMTWGMIRRSWSLTTEIGALLGAGYGIVLFATSMLTLWQVGPNSQVLPLAMVMLYAVLIAALFGAVVAGLIGFVAGPLGGLLCALLTRSFFLPPRSERLYRVIAATSAGVYGMFTLVVAIRLISTSGFAPPIQTVREAIMLYVIPALLGGAAGVFISQPVIAGYMQARDAVAAL